MTQLTGFQTELLIIITERGELIGQDVKDEMQKRFEMEVNHGRLYPNLDNLVEDGLVEKEAADRRSYHYRPTGNGRMYVVGLSERCKRAIDKSNDRINSEE